MSNQKIIDNYAPDFCARLEAAYGPSMMSEGGTQATATMFADVEINNKKALEIGFGLGGVAQYLAENHQMNIVGLEVNPKLVEEAKRRVPPALKTKLDFVCYEGGSPLPFEDASFDIVYSKGVLAVIPGKQEFFQDIARVLKPQGQLVIIDWLSKNGNWGPKMHALKSFQGLSFHSESMPNYMNLLYNAGFMDLHVKDVSSEYSRYNHEIVDKLESIDVKKNFCENFGIEAHDYAVQCYTTIAEAMEFKDLMVMWFSAKKTKT